MTVPERCIDHVLSGDTVAHMPIRLPYRKPKITDAEETEMRRRYFKEKQTGEQICADFKISKAALTIVLGESPGRKGWKPEKSYA
jgi:hypothetical protein